MGKRGGGGENGCQAPSRTFSAIFFVFSFLLRQQQQRLWCVWAFTFLLAALSLSPRRDSSLLWSGGPAPKMRLDWKPICEVPTNIWVGYLVREPGKEQFEHHRGYDTATGSGAKSY